MQTVQTIEQGGTAYTISQMGNRSYRISFRRKGERKVTHVTTIFDTCEEAEAYITSCGSMDALDDMLTITGRQQPRQTNDSPIARRRIARGMTQQQLAEAIGCKQKDVARWETGSVTPRVDKMIRIAAALECGLDDLV